MTGPQGQGGSRGRDEADEVFAAHRPLLFTLAYEITGSAADAEDVVQESYLRWSRLGHREIAHPRAYLARIATRQALNQLRTVRRRREEYVGSWLPEPLCTEPDASEDVLLAESVSTAMLLVLESLGPDERAVFVLRDVFGYEYPEIAEMTGRTQPAVRQIAHRARSHVRARRRRHRTDSRAAAEIAGRFLAAAHSGDVRGLMELMAPDVVQISDGGGKAAAAPRPLVGRERVARFLVGLAAGEMRSMRAEPGTHNAMPSVLFHSGTRLDTVLTIDIEDGLVRGLFAIRNPDKLTAAEAPVALTREKEHPWRR
ncbi:RNA polymerase sigma-70 factor [Streptomyces physcomitrii]|uniref:RNA polymerase sigma-70 factor n=1 Tax=Streptomyces physcomitrii TaxID=2724184 RepID=A0ABX1H077_9ACTN|nr:RNA polymerase sigma-70 factor [Streptomyces physcomitrii]NKI41750.1 RNA polymerase sigma-70 factor [Streptomyces physcomitrii]